MAAVLIWRGRKTAAPIRPQPLPTASARAAPSAADSSWPAAAASLVSASPQPPSHWQPQRIYLDAGHGAPDNTGNRSSFCVDEQDFTLRVSEHLANRLSRHGRFEVKLSRSGDQRVGYRARVAAAEAWQAAAFISIHSDVRGSGEPWHPTPDQSCMRSGGHAGFSVLWSDHDDEPLNLRRAALAIAIAEQLAAMGLPAYDGSAYAGLYDAHPEFAGVFVDRHAKSKRIFVLHAPTLPSVIIETHHAWNDREARRWQQPQTLDAFAAAVEVALLKALAPAAPSPASSTASSNAPNR